MKQIILLLATFTFVIAQEENSVEMDSSPNVMESSDTLQTSESNQTTEIGTETGSSDVLQDTEQVNSDSADMNIVQENDNNILKSQSSTTMPDGFIEKNTTNVENEIWVQYNYHDSLDFNLDFGYKGYKWGTAIKYLPRMENMSDAKLQSGTKSIMFEGLLGLDTVQTNFFYSDSGFWKVIIDYVLDEEDADAHIARFLEVEGNITEVYGNPHSTEQTINGPSAMYNDILNIKFARSFYRSSWKKTPVKIMLLLSSIIQQPQTDIGILDENLSILKLIYFNPDFMVLTSEKAKQDSLPSIYEIY